MREFKLHLGGMRSTITVFPADERPSVRPGSAPAESYLLSDENTAPVARELAENSADAVRIRCSDVLVPGEGQKSFDNLQLVLASALEAGLGRDALFLIVGGGVLTDLGSFAGSVYLRGVRVQLFPTTLLAMVDAAVGGKTGVNFRGYKNMVGTFYLAEEVRIYPSLLSSLPEAEFRSGLAEVIKAALLGDPELLTMLEVEREKVLGREPSVIEELIARAVRVKVDIVQEDYREGGRRAFLNLGHTYGHALESVSGFGMYTHGEAVAWGIGRALELGRLLGVTGGEYRRRVATLLTAYGYDIGPVSYAPDQLMAAMGRDKKRSAGKLRFVVQRDLCAAELVTPDPEIVEKSLAAKIEARYDG
ncbi:MAG: 3-dehydroquinate synthase family protein [Spirochaetaceae bacterium]